MNIKFMKSIFIITFIVLMVVGCNRGENYSLSISESFSEAEYYELWNDLKNHYNLDEEARINDFKIVVKNNLIQDIRASVIDNNENDKLRLVNVDFCLECNGENNIKTNSVPVEEWGQYEISITGEEFFTKLNELKGNISMFSLSDYTIISSGETEIQGIKAKYFKLDKGELVEINNYEEVPSFSITVSSQTNGTTLVILI